MNKKDLLVCRLLSQTHSPPLGLISPPFFKIPLFIFKNLISPPLEPLQKFNSPPPSQRGGGRTLSIMVIFFSFIRSVFSFVITIRGHSLCSIFIFNLSILVFISLKSYSFSSSSFASIFTHHQLVPVFLLTKSFITILIIMARYIILEIGGSSLISL